uniref:Nucleotid_trans domain-containing protein n=1 Tax=Panagrellus redivivus TaxID=6233 RepID=A0A7E4VVY7_PANRE
MTTFSRSLKLASRHLPPAKYLISLVVFALFVIIVVLPQRTTYTYNEAAMDKAAMLRHMPQMQIEGVGVPDLHDGHGHDAHVMAPELNPEKRMLKQAYPKRVNMGSCPPLFGKVTVMVAVVTESYKTHYRVAQESLECYLKSTNYTFLLVDLDTDQRVAQNCKHDQLLFKKHCAASVYLEDTDWMLVLDADTGVVNPNHCIEEWIDTRVDIMFYERHFNWEIASGNYIVKNTPFARDFLRRWADWQFIQPANWNGADNGVLQMHLLTTLNPGAIAEAKACDIIWHQATGYDNYMTFVTCCKVMLGATHLWPGKVRIYRRSHGWVRDWVLTADAWSDYDFMFHGWKLQSIETEGWKSPFTKMFNISECGAGYSGWNWRSESRASVAEIKKQLANFEKSAAGSFPKEAQALPYLVQPDVAECYPECDANT